MGQVDDGLPVVHVRGLAWDAPVRNAAALLRPKEHGPVSGDGMTAKRVVALCAASRREARARSRCRVRSGRSHGDRERGDDFEHLGLHISPDLDTVLYTLAGLSDPERGWGRADETWNFMPRCANSERRRFNLGDRDLAVHVERTDACVQEKRSAHIVAHMARRLKVTARIVPMTDGAVRTIVHTTRVICLFRNISCGIHARLRSPV
jgi:LPPG:FO 2-phospho-L-lactate transferase